MTEPQITAVKTTAYIPYSHEMLVDNAFLNSHVCDESCPPPYMPLPVPWPRRARYFLRRRWWAVKRIGGYRLVHKDDIRADD